MKIVQVAKIISGQDGVIWGNELFRFDHLGNCSVYNLNELEKGKVVELRPFAKFSLDKNNLITPHSNSVFWGADCFSKGDEFPLLYTNVYNNPSKILDNLMGACCVYRLQRDGETFKTTLVQIIQIGFVEDTSLWKVSPDKHGVRPYGNFAIDRENKFFHAFVMRDEKLGTRHFKFNIPSLDQGDIDNNYNVKKVILNANDILETFDCPFQSYIQGATFHKGKLYSAEGFSDNINKPAIRVIDVNKKVEELYINLWGNGYDIEPELVDFIKDVCYYSDFVGNLYTLEF